MKVLAVAVGGAIGSVARYLLDGAVLRLTSGFFPAGTFAVNVLGCLLFGIVVGASEERLALTPVLRALVLMGLLGGFTTFSTFTFETLTLLRDRELLRAAANVLGQVVLGLLALGTGYAAGRGL